MKKAKIVKYDPKNVDKVKKVLKGSLDLIPSPSVKIQIMSGKVEVLSQNIVGCCQQTFETKSLLT